MSIRWTPVTGSDCAAALGLLEQILADPPGFIGALDDDGAIPLVEQVAASIPEHDSILLLGIGGSALGARALVDALAPSETRLTVLDNIDPEGVDRTLAKLNLAQTTVLIISKSGGTAETAAQLLRVYRALEDAGVSADEKIIAITDPERGALRELATTRNWRSLPVPSDVGGRFSVMTAVGWLPALACGIDVAGIRRGARAVLDDLKSAREDHGLVRWISGWSAHQDRRQTVVMFSYRDRLKTFGDWFAQLWAESLGKRHDLSGAEVWTGSTPLVARGVTDQHSLVQLFVEGPDDKQYLVLDAHIDSPDPILDQATADLHADLQYLAGKSLGQLHRAELEGTVAALGSAGRPVSMMTLENLDAEHLGALMLTWEMATL
ncbi:MAG: glucose-6-phosphate isomerase, partial [Planctomycetota bacterium]|nr:glucose-6-phosphate isomerase [Planctomycetota bacterium]